MFILEEPYVSNLLLETLEKNQFMVLENSVSDKCKKDYNLNILKDNKVSELIKNSDFKLYSNSENSINWLFNNYKNSDFSKLVQVCKNKYEFRNKIASLYPNFFFQELSLNDFEKLDISVLPSEFIIKPAVGFLSLGVHKVSGKKQWLDTIKTIKSEIKVFKELFPQEVLNSSNFIFEEIIKGEEFAVDAYYDKDGKPIILNIFQHPFVSDDDVSDRVYISSKKIIEENLNVFENLLEKIGKALDMYNFPIHIELIKKTNGEVVPVEINPMRFAGWCTTDLAYFAYGINIYEYFENNLKPDWNKILKDRTGKIYYFAMAETPQGIDKSRIEFDYEGLKKTFSKILEFRKIDYISKPLFAIIFGATSDENEITKILQLDMNSFIK